MFIPVYTSICIVERIQISYFLALSRVAMFYATTEQTLIQSFWNLKIRRKINQFHQSSFNASSIYDTTQNNPWICQYRFNGKVFLIFSVSPLRPNTHKIKKSTVEFHTSKNILKMIKQSNQSHQVLFYISNTLNYTFIHFGMSISCEQGSLLISK